MYDRKLRNGDVASACQCHQDGDPIARPLGPMTGGFTTKYYPYANASLASVWDARAYLHGKLVSLSEFRSKAAIVINTASN